MNKEVTNEITFMFKGFGFAFTGQTTKTGKDDYTLNAEMYIDDKLIETAKLPTNFTQRGFTPFWRYQLNNGEHSVRLRILNPSEEAKLFLGKVIVYDAEPVSHKF